jgi:hypothetical protein
MKDDPLRLLMLEELRELRRGRGMMTPDRIAIAKNLIEDFGRGTVEQAYTALLDLLDRHGTDPEGDVRAYFDTAGFVYDDETLEQRLKAYAAEHFVDPRTALRRSDRGAERLSYVVRDSYVGDRPWGHFSFIQDGPAVLIRLEIALDSHSKFRRPYFSVNGGDDVDRTVFDLHETIQYPDRLSAVYRHPAVALRRDAGDGQPLLYANVHWQMPVWPTWMMTGQLSDSRLFSRMTVSRNNRIAMSINWNNDSPEYQARPFTKLWEDDAIPKADNPEP